MAINLGRYFNGAPMRGLWIGDSITGTFAGSTSPAWVAMIALRKLFGAVAMPPLASPFWPPVYKTPLFTAVDGVAGREAKTIGVDAPTMDAYLASLNGGPVDFAVIQMGINDASSLNGGGTTEPTESSSSLTLLQRLNVTRGIPFANMVWIGPSSNAGFQAKCIRVDVLVGASCASVGATYVTCSDLDATNGVNTVDGVHPNAAGAALWAPRWQTGFNVTL